ncbi:hypothetical protein PZB74_09695 [Porifericola rhodea]|uniref:hypothetical protein n=1 Tax=Porifericola rhodea TaxID=930972 RepID=UPI002664F014|nr:hypothetical protein [Porifericola rhodea]WKN33601.1 hypothetical protein PZB74_09695 [Porifericola rhodea]
MKAITKTLTLALVAIFVSISAFANVKVDKTTEKARQAVNSASPDDWHTYAISAEKCIKKNVNLKEASEWIKKSVEIKETSYNLKVLGDYYAKNKLPQKAVEAYSKSIRLGKMEDSNYTDKATQDKIVKLVKQLG